MNISLFTRTAHAMSAHSAADSFSVPVSGHTETTLDFTITVVPSRPQTRGDRDYLRALRAAEMVAWQASGGDALNLTNSP
jgi:hypothetical protein